MNEINYGYSKKINTSFEHVIKRVKEELQKEGFGILTEIDVKETLKNKLDVDFDKYIILGACNPNFAHEALLSEQNIGLLLPCNVLVYEHNDEVWVSVLNPEVVMGFIKNDQIKLVANKVGKKLNLVFKSI